MYWLIALLVDLGKRLLVLWSWFVGALFRLAELLCVLRALLGFVGGLVVDLLTLIVLLVVVDSVLVTGVLAVLWFAGWLRLCDRCLILVW